MFFVRVETMVLGYWPRRANKIDNYNRIELWLDLDTHIECYVSEKSQQSQTTHSECGPNLSLRSFVATLKPIQRVPHKKWLPPRIVRQVNACRLWPNISIDVIYKKPVARVHRSIMSTGREEGTYGVSFVLRWFCHFWRHCCTLDTLQVIGPKRMRCNQFQVRRTKCQAKRRKALI